MAEAELDMADLERRMQGAISVLKTEFAGLRTGRASSGMMDPITAAAYGSQMPINQLATISVPEPRMISVQVWDKSMVSAVEKAIRELSFGLNPVTEGQLLRIPIPELNEERRLEYAKIAHKYAEQARISVRHVRKDGIETLRKMEKGGEISQDEYHIYGDDVQELTDRMIVEIDNLLNSKEEEITQV